MKDIVQSYKLGNQTLKFIEIVMPRILEKTRITSAR
jgi:hypothetical protein